MNKIDVTKKCLFSDNDEELLPLLKCVCGKEFDSWGFTISIYSDGNATGCPECGRQFYFTNEIKIYEIINGVNNGRN